MANPMLAIYSTNIKTCATLTVAFVEHEIHGLKQKSRGSRKYKKTKIYIIIYIKIAFKCPYA